MITQLTKIQASFKCSHCQGDLKLSPFWISKYLKRQPVDCDHCRKSVNWWQVCLDAIKDNIFGLKVFSLLGAESAAGLLEVLPNAEFQIDFSEFGVPENALILEYNFTHQDSNVTSYVQVGNNTPNKVNQEIRHRITLYGAGFNGNVNAPSRLAVFVTWLEHSANDEALRQLTAAFRAYYAHQYESAIIPANIAVESRLDKLLTRFLEGFAGKEKVESFLTNAATYSYQLNLLLPLAASVNNVAPLDDHIRGQLNRLRGFRNDISHTGQTSQGLQNDDVAQLLCAALFAYDYLDVLETSVGSIS